MGIGDWGLGIGDWGLGMEDGGSRVRKNAGLSRGSEQGPRSYERGYPEISVKPEIAASLAARANRTFCPLTETPLVLRRGAVDHDAAHTALSLTCSCAS